MKKILLWCMMLVTGSLFAQGTTQLGSGTGTTSYFPNYYLYNYSYSQTIYTAAELTAQGAVAGNISKIRYKSGAAVATTNWKDWEVYMLGTAKATFTTTTDWLPVGTMTKVFDSTLPTNTTAGAWMELTLSTPFAWNGTDNIAIAVYEKTPTYGTSPSWAGYNTNTAGKGIYKYQDAVFTPAAPPTGTLTTATGNVAQIQFAGTITPPPSTPPACTTIIAPANNATNVSVTPTISWNGVNIATSYLVNVGTSSGASDVVNGVEVTTTSYAIPATPLNFTTQYFVTIIPKNNIGQATGCTETSFTTMSLPCPAVTAPVAGASGQSLTPTISWTAVAGADGYTVTVGSSAGASDIVGGQDVGTATSYTFATPLSSGTKYYYTINSYKGASTSASCTERNFTTVCNPYTIPYFEGFETGYTHNTAVAGCLAQAAVTGTSAWTANASLTDYNRAPRTGSWNAFLQYSNTRWLFIPVQLTGGVTYQVKLYARQNASSGANIAISYGTSASDAGMANVILPLSPVTSGAYQKFSGNFVPATTGTYFVGIKGDENATPWYISLDDISIDLAPTCFEPTALVTSNIGPATATVSWTAPATAPAGGYDVYYDTTNTAPVATTTPNANVAALTYNMTGLTPNTQYFVWVRSHCSSTDSSAWVALPSLNTACTATNVPYVENFESAVVPAMPNCTSAQNAGTGNNWVTASTPGSGFTTKALKYGYNANAANAWFYTQGINLTKNTNYTIEFNYGNNSSSYTEKLKVAFGTSTDAASMTNAIVDLSTINQSALQFSTTTFTVPADGVYYFGFNVYSATNQFNLYVDNIKIDLALATNETNLVKDAITIYPNPFADVLHISDVRNVKAIAITDASGRLVKTIDRPTSELQLGDLKTGMYLVTLQYKDGSAKTMKAMKK